jgi:CRP/FNR family transcriptional regulator, anaerobic regulatory protein
MYKQIRNYYESFIRITDEQWSLLEERLVLKKIKKGDFYTSKGEVCNDVVFLNKGMAKMYDIIEEKEYIKAFFFENQYLSEYCSFLTRKPSEMYIEIIEDAEVLSLDYDSVQLLYEKIPEYQKFGRLIAEYLFIEGTQRTASLLADSPEQRYLKLQKNNPHIIQRIPQYMVASYLGVTPEALSRIRKRTAASM